jgi:hypothetical protein
MRHSISYNVLKGADKSRIYSLNEGGKMRKVSILFVLALFILSGSLAFPNTIGIKGGTNFSGFFFEDKREADGSIEQMLIPGRHRNGFALGAFYNIEIIDGFSLQPEIFFTVKGGVATTFAGTSAVSWVEKMSYLELPILFKYELDNLSLLVGPFVALLIQDELKGAIHNVDFRYERTKEEIDRKDFDSGIVFGAGITSGKAFFEIRYTMGFISVIEDSTMKTRSLAFLLGLSF